MDAASTLNKPTMYDYLHEIVVNCVGTVDSSIHLYCGDNQTSADQTGHAEYVFVDVHLLDAEKHSLMPCSYRRNVIILIEAQVSRTRVDVGMRIMAALEKLFQRRLDAPNDTVVSSITPTKIHNQTGTRFGLNIALDYTFNI